MLTSSNQHNASNTDLSFIHSAPLKDVIRDYPVIEIIKSHPDFNVNDAIKFACMSGHLEIVEFMFDLVCTECADDSLLEVTAEYGHLEVVVYLIKHEYVDRSTYESAMKVACEKGHTDIVRYLYENESVELDNKVLLDASANGHLELVKYLITILKKTKSFTVRMVLEDDALLLACANGHLEVVKYLLYSGADSECKDNEAVCIAAENNRMEVVEFLVKEDADIWAQDGSAVLRAAKNGHLEMVKYLISKRCQCSCQR